LGNLVVKSPSNWGKSPKDHAQAQPAKPDNTKKSLRNNELQIFVTNVGHGTLHAVGRLVEAKLNIPEEHKDDTHASI
jgi:hypothetical protein